MRKDSVFVPDYGALERLVEDAKAAGLNVEYDARRPREYTIAGIKVWESHTMTFNFGRVRRLIEEAKE